MLTESFKNVVEPILTDISYWMMELDGVHKNNVDHKMKFRSKKGLLPFIELNGEEISDSSVIIKELGQRFGKDLDEHLDNNQRSISHAMISMIENHLHWVVMYWRTKHPDHIVKGYKMNLQHFLGSRVPSVFLNFFFKYSYGRKGSKKVKAHGIGVHKPEEIDEFGQNDLKVLSEMLGDKQFFFGDDPTNLDIVAFANLAQIYFVDKELKYSLQEFMVEKCQNLCGHVNRVKEKSGDLDARCARISKTEKHPSSVQFDIPTHQSNANQTRYLPTYPRSPVTWAVQYNWGRSWFLCFSTPTGPREIFTRRHVCTLRG
ncbi:unnamed protein product, partial [Nesidiocoris tenuis]